MSNNNTKTINYEIIQVMHNCMHPCLNKGDFVIIDKNIEKFVSTGIYLMKFNHHKVFRRVIVNEDDSVDVTYDNKSNFDNPLIGIKIDSIDILGKLI